MPTDFNVDLPLIDHHCHGVSPAELDYKGFQALFSESYLPPPEGTSEFQKPLGLMIRRFCAPMLDLEKLASGEAYVARRLELGAMEVNRRLMTACGLDSLLVDTGHKSNAIMSFQEMGRISGKPAHEVVRIEAVAEEVAKSGVSAADFPDVFAAELEKRATGAVGLKTIVAYRVTFAIDQTAPSKQQVVGAAGDWFRKAAEAKRWRLENSVIIRYGLWVGGELCRKRKFPMQVHVGFGDPDIYMHACDPTHFTDFIAAMEKWQVPITLLHCYPFQREAGLVVGDFPERLLRCRRGAELYRRHVRRHPGRGAGDGQVLEATLLLGRLRPGGALLSGPVAVPSRFEAETRPLDRRGFLRRDGCRRDRQDDCQRQCAPDLSAGLTRRPCPE